MKDAMETISPEVEQYIRELFQKFPVHQFLNMRLQAVREKEVEVTVPIIMEMTTCYEGYMQGGFFGPFTDSPMWIAIMTDKSWWGAEIYTIDPPYAPPLKRVRAGEVLTILARHVETVRKNGRIIFLSAAEVKNEKGETVAMARAQNILVRRGKNT